jgi:hypothetical protein
LLTYEIIGPITSYGSNQATTSIKETIKWNIKTR